MSERNTVLRSMHDIGLAGWFGGSLMGAVGLNGAAAQAASPAERLQIASAGWDRWAPVNLAAIGAHLVGATGILVFEAPRVASQKGVGAMSVAKTALTAAALGATAYSRLAGKKMEKAGGTPVEGITEPAASTPGCSATRWLGTSASRWVGMWGDGNGPADGVGGARWCPGCRGGDRVVAVSRSRG